MNSARELKNRLRVRASAILNVRILPPLSKHVKPSRLPGLFALATCLLAALPHEASAATMVWPDTLAVKSRRHAVVPAMRPLRKTVGLALSGGGANGFAQIGVLKAFEEEKIPVDIIAGTSIGAIIGGLYSTGYSASDLETIALSLPLQKLLSLDNDAPRTSSYLEQKSIRDRATIAIRFDGLKLVLPKSLSSAQPLTRTIDLLVLNAPYHTVHGFSDLPVAFRAVTTDLVSGRRVTLASGPLSEAMRASSTIPLLYQPITRKGVKLADGGLVANLPVDELDEAAVQYKIAVDSHGGMYSDGDDIDVPWKAADQAMTILTQVQYPMQIEKADIVLSPELGDRKATDLSDFRSLIDAGYARGKLLAPIISRNILAAPTGEILIGNRTTAIRGIPDDGKAIELASTAKGIIRHATGVKAALRELLVSDLFSSVHAEIDDRERRITFVVTPLPRIERVSVEGGPAGAVSQKQIDEAFRPVVGTIYTNSMGTSALEALVRSYRNRGFSLVGIDRTEVGNGCLRISLSAGNIDAITITQDKQITRETPIRRELSIDTTKPFSLRQAERSIDNLYGTGVFNRVSLSTESTEPVSAKHPSSVNIRLDEKPATVLRLGLRYDETSNAQVLVDFRNENLGGTTNSIGGWAKVSEKNNRVNLEFGIPRIGSTPLTWESRAFFDQRDLETRQRNLASEDPDGQIRGFGIQRYGVATAFGARIGKNARIAAEATLQNAQAYPNKLNREDASLAGNVDMASLGTRFTLDTRDSSFLPSEGRYVNLRYTRTPSAFNSEHQDFWQLSGSHEENVSLGSRTVLQLSAAGGISSATIPFSEKFFIGGTGTAYSYRFIGLKENDLIGNNFAVAGAQLRYKPSVQLVFPTSLVATYNAGNVWQVRQQMSISKLVQGLGLGLVWETPLGPARMTVARTFAFDSEEVTDDAALDFSETLFYFSLGHDF